MKHKKLLSLMLSICLILLVAMTASATDVNNTEANIDTNGAKFVVSGETYDGDQYFADIYGALDFIKTRDTATIKLLDDMLITADQRMFTNYSFIINAEYITLDLNGKTITFDYEGSTKECLASIAIYNGGTLTVVDTSKEQTGTLYSKTLIQGKEGPRIIWVTSAGTATIEGGRFISEQAHTMFYTSNSNKDIPACLYIKGGYFEHTVPTEGGKYRYFNQQNGTQKQIIEVSGGVFAHNPTDGEMSYPEGYEPTVDADGNYNVHIHTYNVESANCTTAKICTVCNFEAEAIKEHVYSDFIADNNATCKELGTKTSKCINDCGASIVEVDEDSVMEHKDADGNGKCDSCKGLMCKTCDETHKNFFGKIECFISNIFRILRETFNIIHN